VLGKSGDDEIKERLESQRRSHGFQPAWLVELEKYRRRNVHVRMDTTTTTTTSGEEEEAQPSWMDPAVDAASHEFGSLAGLRRRRGPLAHLSMNTHTDGRIVRACSTSRPLHQRVALELKLSFTILTRARVRLTLHHSSRQRQRLQLFLFGFLVFVFLVHLPAWLVIKKPSAIAT